jgi:Flp pilus assembly pilin Flp
MWAAISFSLDDGHGYACLMKHSDGHDAGATMVEYSLMVSLIAVVALVGVQLFGNGVQGLFGDVVGAIVDLFSS